MNTDIRTLVISSNGGRYALDNPEGPDISSGNSLAIMIGGQWIEGRVEYSRKRYTNEQSSEPRAIQGYYFISDDGGICGLCAGMEVRRV
jgi:hypothetical protein